MKSCFHTRTSRRLATADCAAAACAGPSQESRPRRNLNNGRRMRSSPTWSPACTAFQERRRLLVKIEWERSASPVVLDNLIHAGEVAPLIAVMVDPVNRMAEYLMNDGYADLVNSELLPHIDGRFRTLARPEGRGVIGASLGGLISVYLALERPDLFSRVASQSGAFFIAHDRILNLARSAHAAQSFYFDVGKYEQRFIAAHLDLVETLEARGCRCFFQELGAGTTGRAGARI